MDTFSSTIPYDAFVEFIKTQHGIHEDKMLEKPAKEKFSAEPESVFPQGYVPVALDTQGPVPALPTLDEPSQEEAQLVAKIMNEIQTIKEYQMELQTLAVKTKAVCSALTSDMNNLGKIYNDRQLACSKHTLLIQNAVSQITNRCESEVSKRMTIEQRILDNSSLPMRQRGQSSQRAKQGNTQKLFESAVSVNKKLKAAVRAAAEKTPAKTPFEEKVSLSLSASSGSSEYEDIPFPVGWVQSQPVEQPEKSQQPSNRSVADTTNPSPKDATPMPQAGQTPERTPLPDEDVAVPTFNAYEFIQKQQSQGGEQKKTQLAEEKQPEASGESNSSYDELYGNGDKELVESILTMGPGSFI